MDDIEIENLDFLFPNTTVPCANLYGAFCLDPDGYVNICTFKSNH